MFPYVVVNDVQLTHEWTVPGLITGNRPAMKLHNPWSLVKSLTVFEADLRQKTDNKMWLMLFTSLKEISCQWKMFMFVDVFNSTHFHGAFWYVQQNFYFKMIQKSVSIEGFHNDILTYDSVTFHVFLRPILISDDPMSSQQPTSFTVSYIRPHGQTDKNIRQLFCYIFEIMWKIQFD